MVALRLVAHVLEQAPSPPVLVPRQEVGRYVVRPFRVVLTVAPLPRTLPPVLHHPHQRLRLPDPGPEPLSVRVVHRLLLLLVRGHLFAAPICVVEPKYLNPPHPPGRLNQPCGCGLLRVLLTALPIGALPWGLLQ